MAGIVKFELERAFRNRRMGAALLTGLCISLWHLWDYILPVAGYVGDGGYPLSSFNKWMGGENYSLQASLYFMWLPILCALPHGASFVSDCASGYGSQAAVRGGWGRYLAAKYMAVFLSGATVAVLPLMFDFLGTNIFLPAVMPQAGMGNSPIGEQSFLGGLYFRHPFLYLLIYLTMDGFFFGLFNTLSLFAAVFGRNRHAVLLTPFVVYTFLFSVGTTTMQFSLCPAGFLRPSQQFIPAPGRLLGEAGALLAAGAVFFLFFRKKEKGFL